MCTQKEECREGKSVFVTWIATFLYHEVPAINMYNSMNILKASELLIQKWLKSYDWWPTPLSSIFDRFEIVALRI